MKEKTKYCTIVFYLKNKHTIIDNTAKIVGFDSNKMVVISNRFYIKKSLIDSISITMIECANMQLTINNKIQNVELIGKSAKYTLSNSLEKTSVFNGKPFTVYNQHIIRKLNVQNMKLER